MDKYFDRRRIENTDVFTESYLGYGKNDLSKMTTEELKSELKRAEADIKTLQDEIDEADSYPSYSMKERMENANLYKHMIEKEISDRDENDISFNKSKNNQYRFKKFNKELQDYK